MINWISRVEPVAEHDKLPALVQLILRYEQADQEKCQQMQQFIEHHEVETDLFVQVRDEDHHWLSCLCMPRSGRTGMLFLPEINLHAQAPLLEAMLEKLRQMSGSHRVNLLQALIDPEAVIQALALANSGYAKIAELIYMQRRIPEQLTPVNLPEPYQLINYHPEDESLWRETILCSYENTLDCPDLRGLRTMDDIIESHKAVGVFDPKNWYLLKFDDAVLGVLLVGDLGEAQDMIELVYLGLTPEARGKGLGRKLVQQCLIRGRELGRSQVVLAVDAMNKPALNIYRGLGFFSTDRKVAWLRTRDEA